MAYINQKRFVELRKAAKDGDESAKEIIQALLKNREQADVDRLINKYYEVDDGDSAKAAASPHSDVVTKPADKADDRAMKGDTDDTKDSSEQSAEIIEQNEPDYSDLDARLDKDLDGIVAEGGDIPEIQFRDFLKKKGIDGMKASRGADYFKSYDPDGRHHYIEDRLGKYQGKYAGRLKNIERFYSDMGHSLDGYSQSVNDMLDDSVEIDPSKVSGAYGDMTKDDDMMDGMVRYWDDADRGECDGKVKALVAKYGKKNVLGALNSLKNDNQSYHDFRKSQIDTAVGDYKKSLESLLK